jgi:hypothetical protein
VPSAWTGAVPGSQASGPPASPGNGAVATGAPAQSAARGSVGGSTGGDGGTAIGLLIAIAIIVLVVAVALVARRRRGSETAP